MDLNILLLLFRDGLSTGAIYAMLGVAFVLVFAVTRVLFVPQGDFVAFAALTMVSLEQGRLPGLTGLLVVLAGLATLSHLFQIRSDLTGQRVLRVMLVEFGLPLLLCAVVMWLAPLQLGLVTSIPLTIAMMTLIGMAVYRIIFAPLAKASVLVLLIAAFGVHMALVGMGLYVFGPEGFQSQPLSTAAFQLSLLRIPMHDVIVLVTVATLMVGLWWYSSHTRQGKALRASAVNRLGASLVGISTGRTGSIAFGLAAAIGAISGILVGPVTTVYYDTGFMIGLKGLVAAVLGGLVSYPLTLVSALGLGVFETFSAFWASAYKETLVFLLVLPVLLWRSLVSSHPEDEE